MNEGMKKDQRVVRTRKRVDASFVELLHRRAYGNIRVSDITRKAGVGRATFYAHYSSKDDLLRSQFNRIVVPMLAIQPNEACPLDATALFAHIQTAPRIYRGLVGSEAGHGPRVLQQLFDARVRQALEQQKSQFPTGFLDGADGSIVTRFLASSLLVVVESCVEGGTHRSPEEAQAIFARLVGGALVASRGTASKS